MKILLSTALVLAALVSVTTAQGKPDLDGLYETISSHLESNLPGWKHKRLPPFGGTTTVLTQSWSSGTSAVMVAVAIRESPEDAKKEVRSFLQSRQEAQRLTGIGDEAFLSGFDDSHIVLRKGRCVIYVSTYVEIESYADARNLSQVELAARRKSEVQRITKEFARLLSSVELQ
jgi:hypothetical protein